ncbi:MAG: STAS domain-containing protein [Gammaproteobacteria bacterium]|nr:STAS domain-containing protein [Gammaproteobacteria bacterium]MBU1441332.1 STAS domain-containing protein [Gammaproteobacteria bacterium]
MELATRTDSTGIFVVALRVDNLDAGNVQEFKQRMQLLIQDQDRVVLDLDGVNFIDSSGLGALISCLRQVNSRKGDMRLCNPSVTVQALFELMRMQRVFQIHASVTEAVESFA